MKVFISWSGDKSRAVAEALSQGIRNVIQDADCFFSPEIEAGTQWLKTINAELAATSFGIVCVTADNQHKPWLNFEAGALAKSLGDENRVVPLTFDFTPDRIDSHSPLRQFQAVASDHDGILKLMQSINKTGTQPRTTALVEETFEMWWSKLSEKFADIASASTAVILPAAPKTEDLVAEILDVVRGIAKRLPDQPAKITQIQFEEVARRNLKSRHPGRLSSEVTPADLLAWVDTEALQNEAKSEPDSTSRPPRDFAEMARTLEALRAVAVSQASSGPQG